ncbi:type II toxin-antitoxin system Phd/YefM family antitoxin [soil metagenome]
MTEIASRELRNHTRAVLDRVADGEVLTVTQGGRPVAVLGPPEDRQRWIPAARFADLVAGRQADAALRRELLELADQTTDDLPL